MASGLFTNVTAQKLEKQMPDKLYALDKFHDPVGVKFGIGTDPPTVRLKVVGDGNISAVFSSRNVGVGIGTPTETLEVGGDILADSLQLNEGIIFPDGTIMTTAVDLTGGTVDTVPGQLHPYHYRNGGHQR